MHVHSISHTTLPQVFFDQAQKQDEFESDVHIAGQGRLPRARAVFSVIQANLHAQRLPPLAPAMHKVLTDSGNEAIVDSCCITGEGDGVAVLRTLFLSNHVEALQELLLQYEYKSEMHYFLAHFETGANPQELSRFLRIMLESGAVESTVESNPVPIPEQMQALAAVLSDHDYLAYKSGGNSKTNLPFNAITK
eukprot:6492726-Amphidinium_carterae.5